MRFWQSRNSLHSTSLQSAKWIADKADFYYENHRQLIIKPNYHPYSMETSSMVSMQCYMQMPYKISAVWKLSAQSAAASPQNGLRTAVNSN